MTFLLVSLLLGMLAPQQGDLSGAWAITVVIRPAEYDTDGAQTGRPDADRHAGHSGARRLVLRRRDLSSRSEAAPRRASSLNDVWRGR